MKVGDTFTYRDAHWKVVRATAKFPMWVECQLTPGQKRPDWYVGERLSVHVESRLITLNKKEADHA